MADVETDTLCEGESQAKLGQIPKVTACSEMTAHNAADHNPVHSCQNRNTITEINTDHKPVISNVSKTENQVPNGCVRRKLGENGLLAHGSLVSKETHNHDYVNDCCKALGNVDSDFRNMCIEDSEKVTSVKSCCKVLDKNPHTVNNSCDSGDCTETLARLSLEDCDVHNGIEYVVYQSELQMPDIMRLITKDLSEPYSIYTYRYFIHNWPKLCFLAMFSGQCVGAIVCKLDMHKKMVRRGYIAMLAIDSEFRRKKIGSHLVLKAIKAMIADDCDEVVLETEITNKAALRLYENLGFVRDKRLFRYYLNGVDALRLKLWLR